MTTVPTFSVSDINLAIKTVLESELFVQDCFIVGEVSNLRPYSAGRQLYFNLIDSQSQINCVVFGAHQKKQFKSLKDGMKIKVKGQISVFHKRGTYSLQVAYFEPMGKGSELEALEQLKAKLLKEGLFDEDKKRRIPQYPDKIGLITAPNSAALADFTRLLSDGAGHVQIVHVPAVMQGMDSPASVSAAIDILGNAADLDVIVLCRGGGSAEDLASFNSETIVRKVASSRHPIISAVGHEIDVTLTDFAADKRLATPSAAAQSLTAPFIALRQDLPRRLDTAGTILQQQLQHHQSDIATRLNTSHHILSTHLNRYTDTLKNLLKRAESNNPIHRLRQGYSLTRSQDGTLITHINNCKEGDVITTQLSDGSVESVIRSHG